MPVARLENGSWPHPSRLPLGCGWSGYCTAPEHEGQTPSQDVLESLCNLGYAGHCAWAPSHRNWDAVRFAVVSPEITNAPQENGNSSPAALTLQLHYVCERDHLPVEDGKLLFELNDAVWLRRHEDPRVQKMAQCFLESYLKKRLS